MGPEALVCDALGLSAGRGNVLCASLGGPIAGYAEGAGVSFALRDEEKQSLEW